MLSCRISPGAIAVFTDRAGGVSAPPYDSFNVATHVGDRPEDVARNRNHLETEIGTHVAWMDQVHGATVRVLPSAAPRDAGECDALVLVGAGSFSPAVLVADCVPLLLADATGGVRAAVHVGRAGLFGGIIPRVLNAVRQLTRAPLQAVAGPHICGLCYEVAPALAAEAGGFGAQTTTRWGTPGISLIAGIRRQLDGVPLTEVGGCTFESPEWYSYRRDGTTGRFAGVVVRDTPRRMWEAPAMLQ